MNVQCVWPPPSVNPITFPPYAPWSLSTNPPPGAENRKKIKAVGDHKGPALDGFSSTMFEEWVISRVRELSIFVFQICYSGQVTSSCRESIVVLTSRNSYRVYRATQSDIDLISIST